MQFSAAGGLGSQVIRVFSRGWASHCDAVLPGGALLGARGDAIGGQPPGVRVRPPAYEPWSRVMRVSLACTDGQQLAWDTFLRTQLGKPYDRLAIAAFSVDRDWRAPDSWFCSELLGAALEASGWLPRPMSDVANELTPRDLLLVVSPWAQAA